MHQLLKEDNYLSLHDNAMKIRRQETNLEQDKLLLLEILNFFARLYLYAAINFLELGDREKERFSLHNWYFVKRTITHITGESVHYNITRNNLDTKFQFDKLKVFLQDQALLIRWNSSEMVPTMFDFDDADRLLETILQDQTILANTQA